MASTAILLIIVLFLILDQSEGVRDAEVEVDVLVEDVLEPEPDVDLSATEKGQGQGQGQGESSRPQHRIGITELTDDNFDSITKVATPYPVGIWYIEFFAEWCGQCQSMKPIWERVSADLVGKVNVGVVDGEKNAILSERFMISSYPTIILIRRGKMYVYNGGQLTQKALVDFALKGYQDRGKLLVDPMGIPAKEEDYSRMLRLILGAVVYTPYQMVRRAPLSSSVLFMAGAIVGALTMSYARFAAMNSTLQTLRMNS